MAKTSSKILQKAKKQMRHAGTNSFQQKTHKQVSRKEGDQRQVASRSVLQFNFVEGSLVTLHGRTEGYRADMGYGSMEGGTVALLVNGPYSTEMTRSGWAVDLLVGADLWTSVEAKRLRKMSTNEDDDE